MEKTWPSILPNCVRNLAGASASVDWSESISGSMCGWQRVSPWPMIWNERVMMLAPSTVIATGIAMYALPRKLSFPMQIPAPPRMSIPSCTTRRPRSVQLCFMIDDSTIGASWLSTIAFMSSPPARTMYASRPARASASWMPPNSAIGTRNCGEGSGGRR